MSTISLRDYLTDINTLIDQSRYNEAIFHCTTILKSYPKCVSAYQLLGKSLLENGKLQEAKDVFSKVLAVYPDDFTAHLGLSEFFAKEQQTDLAIWHMERAFETQPSNLLIQEELKRLFSKRDGVPPSKIRLTRGALIRMYAKGELYQQAIAEAQALLQGDKARPDIKILLARMYHLSGSTVEASETCRDILQEIPYCYEANSIMHEIEQNTGSTSEPSLYIARMSEVDPYSGFLSADQPKPENVPNDVIILDKPDYVDSEDIEIPDWAKQIGISWNSEKSSRSLEDIIPASNDNSEEGQVPVLLTDALDIPKEDSSQPSEPEDEELPDWISKAGWIRSIEDEADASALDDITPEDLPPDLPDLASPAEDLPDWLKSLTPMTPQSEESDALEHSMPDFNEPDTTGYPAISNEQLSEIISDPGSLDFIEKERSILDEIISEKSREEPETKIDEIISPVENEMPDLPDWLKDLEISELESVKTKENISDWIPTDVVKETEDSIMDDQDTNDHFDADHMEKAATPAGSLHVTEPGNEIPLAMDSLDDLMKEIEEESAGTQRLNNEPIQPPQGTGEESVKQVVPSWVQRILGSAEIQSTDVAVAPTTETPEVTDELEPLITDLPGEPPEDGAISEDVNLELMDWLAEINPEDALEEKEVVETSEGREIYDSGVIPAMTSELPEISIDNLTDLTSTAAIDSEPKTSVSPDEEFVSVLEESATIEINSRLNSFLSEESADTSGKESEIKIQTLSSEEEIPISTSETKATKELAFEFDQLMHLLDAKNYRELSEKITEETIPEEILNQVLDSSKAIKEQEPMSFELWKLIGDISLKKSDVPQALDAFKQAERILLQK